MFVIYFLTQASDVALLELCVWLGTCVCYPGTDIQLLYNTVGSKYLFFFYGRFPNNMIALNSLRPEWDG